MTADDKFAEARQLWRDWEADGRGRSYPFGWHPELFKALLDALAAAEQRAEKAEGKLRDLENLVARRPALDEATLYGNVAKAIAVAGNLSTEVGGALVRLRPRIGEHATLTDAVNAIMENLITTEAAEHAKADAETWKNTVIDWLVVQGIYQQRHETDPKQALIDLVVWEQDVTMNPAVSPEAAALHKRVADAEARAEKAEAKFAALEYCLTCGHYRDETGDTRKVEG